MDRIINALKLGWGFGGLNITNQSTSRHHLWVQQPNENTWTAHKVAGTSKDPLNDLLDEANVPNIKEK